MPNLTRVERTKFSPDLKFSIVVPTWNNLDCLKLLVRSLRENSKFQHQIILFINDGSDGTLDWATAQNDLDYFHSPENLGICYALNIARDLVKTRFFAYFNDDMYALPGWDAALWREIETANGADFFFSATMIEPFETGNPCVLVADFGRSPEKFDEQKLLSHFKNLEKNDWHGATWPPNILPLELWDKVGGYSIEFSPGMYSDPDFSMKLWFAGVRYFKGVGDSRVYHFGAKSTGRVKKNKGSDVFLKKWGMTSGFFTKKFLRRGEKFDGFLKEPTFSFFEKLKMKWKLIWSEF